MIKKLEIKKTEYSDIFGNKKTKRRYPKDEEFINKINEIIDKINEFNTYEITGGDGDE